MKIKENIKQAYGVFSNHVKNGSLLRIFPNLEDAEEHVVILESNIKLKGIELYIIDVEVDTKTGKFRIKRNYEIQENNWL